MAMLIVGRLADAAPAIQITSVHPYGSNGVMQGVVSGVVFSNYCVAPYIHIEGGGWWTKPTFSNPTVPVNPDGTFTANVTTGGLDDRAVIFCAALVATNYTPPQANGGCRVPADLNSAAIDFLERYARTLTFAGRTWAVKEAPSDVGPGYNRFSHRPEDVWVDGAGLHLTITHRDNQWWASEVILLDQLGYGTYAFKTQSRTDLLDVNVTLGMFTWDAYGDDESSGNSHNRELDFEDSFWGVSSITNTQAVVQPWDVPGNRHRYSLPDLSPNPALTRVFTWKTNSVEFVALKGDQSPTNYPPEAVFDQWLYLHQPALTNYVPRTGRERVHLNLWLNNTPAAPSNGQAVEVVISGFSFTAFPLPTLTAAVSRKVHGSAGTFDLNLNLDPSANPTVEPRRNGPDQIVFTFNKDVKAADGTLDASEFTLTNATYVSASIVSSNLTLNLTNVVDQSKVTVVLNGISDLSGTPLAGTNSIRARALYGDCNQSGTVNAPDLQYVKNRLLQTANAGNFLADLNCSGTINAPDLQAVKNNLLYTAPTGGLEPPSGGVTQTFLSASSTARTDKSVCPTTLGEALGAPDLVWSSNGDNVWTPTIAPDNSSAARSGGIGDLQVSWVETTASGPGTVTFQWKVSSELNGDFLTFSMDGTDQPGRISGEVDWQPMTFKIPEGAHRLRWTYGKNRDKAAGLDAGWLRRVSYQPGQ